MKVCRFIVPTEEQVKGTWREPAMRIAKDALARHGCDPGRYSVYEYQREGNLYVDVYSPERNDDWGNGLTETQMAQLTDIGLPVLKFDLTVQPEEEGAEE